MKLLRIIYISCISVLHQPLSLVCFLTMPIKANFPFDAIYNCGFTNDNFDYLLNSFGLSTPGGDTKLNTDVKWWTDIFLSEESWRS